MFIAYRIKVWVLCMDGYIVISLYDFVDPCIHRVVLYLLMQVHTMTNYKVNKKMIAS